MGASYVRSLNIDEPFVRQSSGNEFYHTDALGSTLALTNQAATVQASYSYEAFGKTTITGSSPNPFQFTGRENDGTGFYYYRARYYSPMKQRFASEDPLSSPLNPYRHLLYGPAEPMRSAELFVWQWRVNRNTQELNLYLYTANFPLRFSDPLGLDKNEWPRKCQAAYDACVAVSGLRGGACVAGCILRTLPAGPQVFAVCLTACGGLAAFEYAFCILDRDACLRACP